MTPRRAERTIFGYQGLVYATIAIAALSMLIAVPTGEAR